MIYRFILAAIALLSSSVYSATILVPQDQPTIQAGITAAVNGDTVLVSPGTYVETLTCNKGICLISTDGPEVTIVRSAAANTRLLAVTGSANLTFVLSGFTLKGAVNANGAILSNGPHYRIENNYITDNKEGNNLVVSGNNGKVLNNKIWNNSGGACSGVLVGDGSNIEIAYNEVYGNSGATCAGIRTDGGSGKIHHNIIYENTNNSSINAAALNINGVWQIQNNTVVANSSTAGSVAVWLGNSAIDVRNNIVVGSQNCFGIRAAGNAQYNDCWNNELGDFQYSSVSVGNLSLDPKFYDPLGHNFALSYDSPCRDSGDPDSLYNDFDGSRADIGALEYFPVAFPVALRINCGLNIPADSVPTLTPTVFWSYFDTAATAQSAFEIEVGTDGDWTAAEMWQSGTITTADTSIVYGGLPLIDHNRYFLRIRLNDGINWGEWSLMSFQLRISATILVPQELPTIQGAIDAARPRDSIIVAAGIYQENIVVDKALVLIAPDGPGSTEVHPRSTSNRILECFAVGTDSIIVTGFTFSGVLSVEYAVTFTTCKFRFEGNRVVDNSGIAAVLASAAGGVIRRNKISGNQGSTCGGIQIEGIQSVFVEHNVIADNTSPISGGMFLGFSSRGVIKYNVLTGNSGSSNGYASVINANGVWKILSNTVVLNSSGASTAAVWIGGADTDVRNNIVAMNEGCYGIRAATNPGYNDCFQNSLGNFHQCVLGPGNTSVDPLFVDIPNSNWELQEGSPCRDTGDPNQLYLDPDGTRCDIGAFPYFSAIRTVNLRLINETDPEHLLTETPSIGWSFINESLSPQDQFEIAVGTDEDWTVAETWNPPVFDSDDSTIVYAGTPLVDGVRYWLRVRGHGASGWSNWGSITFRTNSKPTVPVLYYPEDGASVSTLIPSLQVQNSSDGQKDSIFYTFVITRSSPTSIPETLIVKQWDSYVSGVETPSLLEDQKYFWKVRASDYLEESDWSATRSFWVNIGNSAPFTFQLSSPPNGFTFPLGERVQTFSWQPAFDPDPYDHIKYELQIATDSDFEFRQVIPNLDTTSYTLWSPLDWRLRYWWKVKATDKQGDSVWSSDVFKFRMMMPGDVDGNLTVNISDAVYLVNYVFAGGPAPIPPVSGDADCSEFISISDAVYLIQYIFNGGPQPCDPTYQKDSAMDKAPATRVE